MTEDHVLGAEQLREVVGGQADAPVWQIKAEFVTHRPAQPRIGARRRRPDALDQSAGDATGVPGFQNGANGLISSLLMTEAAQALGLSGFAGTVFTVTGSAITRQLLTNLENMAEASAGGSVDLGASTVDGLFAGFDSITFATNLGAALGGSFGTYLGSQVFAPTDQDGALGAQIGSTVGGDIGGRTLSDRSLLARGRRVELPVDRNPSSH